MDILVASMGSNKKIDTSNVKALDEDVGKLKEML